MTLDRHAYDWVPVPHSEGQRFENQVLVKLDGRVEMWLTDIGFHTIWLHDFQRYLLSNKRRKREDADELDERVVGLLV